eukprot:123400_1
MSKRTGNPRKRRRTSDIIEFGDNHHDNTISNLNHNNNTNNNNNTTNSTNTDQKSSSNPDEHKQAEGKQNEQNQVINNHAPSMTSTHLLQLLRDSSDNLFESTININELNMQFNGIYNNIYQQFMDRYNVLYAQRNNTRTNNNNNISSGSGRSISGVSIRGSSLTIANGQFTLRGNSVNVTFASNSLAGQGFRSVRSGEICLIIGDDHDEYKYNMNSN